MTKFAACLILLTLLPCVESRSFRSSDLQEANFVRQELQGILTEVLGHGHGVESVRLEKIEKSLAPIFRALPKNNQGRLSAPVMRYSVQRYFSQQYGWVVKGFEPHAHAANISDATANVVQSKLPEYIR